MTTRFPPQSSVPGTILTSLFVAAVMASPAFATLANYDAVVATDEGGGFPSLAKLGSAVSFNDVDKAAFNFGPTSGDVTIEFILGGDPVAGGPNGYLAVGANATSNLRFEQWSDTGQLGFTQLGVADYLFSPVVPTPVEPVHIAYVWRSATRTMELFLNGSIAGSRSGVDAAFAMPSGLGWLGNSAAGTEGMVGTVHRVTVYDDILPAEVILRHADAYNDIVRPPVIGAFTATPAAIFTPGSSTLTWSVSGFDSIVINGIDVTELPVLTVSPSTTTEYELVATNAGGSATSRVTLLVNPAPIIDSFSANRLFVPAGGPVTLTWSVRFGQSFAVSPGVGDVTAATVNGAGSIMVQPLTTTTYGLAAMSGQGSAQASLTIEVVQPAAHLIISEFMADNESGPEDDDGERSDWIEVFNPTSTAVNLLGYSLKDSDEGGTGWLFPEITLPAGGYLVVWASGKDRDNPAAPLHTDFKLERLGEYLALVAPGAVVIHEFAPLYPGQEDDVSYGLLGGDPALVRFMGVPTPGAENDATPPPPARVEFSHPGGTFTANFDVTLTTAAPGAAIRYTTDGTVPDGATGMLYSTPIPITTTSRLRAVAIKDGRLSRVTGASYVRLAADLAGYTSTLPILVIENFGAGTIPQKGWSGTGAGIRQVPRQSAFWAAFERSGDGTSAPIAAPEMIGDIGIRGRGAFSSTWRQKPYSVEAIDPAGNESEAAPLGMPAHADWVLYFPDPDSNKDPSLLFNTFAYELSRNFGNYSVRFRWVEAFINEDGGDLRLADRRGVYALIEKVSRGRDRLDFRQLSSDGASGGWLLNLNRMDPEPESGWPAPNGATQPWFFHTAGPNRLLQSPPNGPVAGDDEPQQSNGYLNFDNPSGYRIKPAQRAAIEGWFTQFEDALWNNSLWRDPLNGYRKYLDERDFVDYFILNVLTRNGDGLLISMFPWKGDDGKLRMGPAWDYNWSAYYISGGPTGGLMHRSDRLWYERLFTDPDFNQLYIDRWGTFRRGPLSNVAIDTIIDGQAADISGAKAVLNGVPSTADWAGRLTTMKNWLKSRADWIDSQFVRTPQLGHPGGNVVANFILNIGAPAGTIYYSLDGTDPRIPNGGIAPGAQTSLPVTLNGAARVVARARVGTAWSAPVSATFVAGVVPAEPGDLVVTEIHYHPAAGAGAANADDLEFVEIQNIGSHPVSLLGVRFARTANAGIDFDFTSGEVLVLAPGARAVVVKDRTAFELVYGAGRPVAGTFSGNLANAGDTLTLLDAAGANLSSFAYGDDAPWPIGADGSGYSLVLVDPTGDPADTGNWRTSVAAGGTPGSGDTVEITGEPLEYAFGSASPELDFNPSTRTLSCARRPGSDLMAVVPERSDDLLAWESGTAAFTFVGESRTPDGGLWQYWTALDPVTARSLFRFRVVPR